MNRLHKIYLIILIISFNACRESSKKDIIEFSFLKVNNDIPENSVSIIAKDWIDIYLPKGIDSSSLIANFSLSDKSIATINGIPQISGITVINFSSPQIYTIQAEDGSSKEYTVTLKLSDFYSLDKNIITLMHNNNAPGISLGITRNENLMFLKSYGEADDETSERVTNNNLFRIASISKMITNLAILKLIEEEKLKLNDKVFGENGILEFDYGTPPYRNEVEQIIVEHLIFHETGWTTKIVLIDSYKKPLDNFIDNEPFTYSPGETYYYSNFGYLVLGRVIEKVTGLNYKQYVKNEILKPLEITDMEIGQSVNKAEYPNEVRYFEQENTSPHPNNWDLTYMDSFGGWIATSKDIMKLLVSFDKLNSKPDILLPSTINIVFNYNNWARDGQLPGTAALVEKMNDEYSYVILTNTHTGNIISDMQYFMKYSINEKTNWPTIDLFKE